MRIYVDHIDPQRVEIQYNPVKQSLMYIVDGVPHHGFIGGLAEQKFIDALYRGFFKITITVDMEHKVKIRQFCAILAKKGLLDLKHDIIAEYGVQSTTELTVEQLDELIAHMNVVSVGKDTREARSVVLNLMGKLGITGSKEDGWSKVNEYLQQPRIAGKALYAMSVQELKECSQRLRSIIHKQTTTDANR